MLDFLKNLTGGPKVDLGELVNAGAIIIDVRTRAEYQGGHVAGSQNIPLNELEQNIKKIQKMGKPVITCCASGARSGVAARNLNAIGIEAHNGGPWTRVNGLV